MVILTMHSLLVLSRSLSSQEFGTSQRRRRSSALSNRPVVILVLLPRVESIRADAVFECTLPPARHTSCIRTLYPEIFRHFLAARFCCLLFGMCSLPPFFDCLYTPPSHGGLGHCCSPPQALSHVLTTSRVSFSTVCLAKLHIHARSPGMPQQLQDAFSRMY